MRRIVLLALGLSILAATPALAQDDPDPIVVYGGLPHCQQRPGDPLDEVDVEHAPVRQSVIKADSHGVYQVVADDLPSLGIGVWQRAGSALGGYRFRVPTDATPFCIGSKGPHQRGFGQLRQVFDAAPAHGKYVRFTAFVATSHSNDARFWVAAGGRRIERVHPGVDLVNLLIPRTGAWIPVQLIIGPVSEDTEKVTAGFLLIGPGDVWVTRPRVEILDEDPATTAKRLSRERRLHPSTDGNPTK